MRLVLGAAVFLAVAANGAFFRNVLGTYGQSGTALLQTVSLGLVLLCALVLLLTLVSARRVLKPALIVLFFVSAATAYFMDTWNVIVDQDMLQNVAETNSAEAADLITARLGVYLLLLGLLPSALVWRLRLRPQPLRAAIRARLLVTGSALAGIVVLVALSTAFYASFAREHKELRYYTNPLTPVYAAWKFARTRLERSDAGPLTPLGRDAHISGADPDRELVILVVGETARADRFSLNGYGRETNPKLRSRDVISFTRVTACGTATETAVPCMFARERQDDFDRAASRTTENALDVLAHAGVNILWRDNNSDSKGVADRIAYEDFRDPQHNPSCDAECRDEGLLAGLDSYIETHPSGDILIVLHQMGSHGPAYHKRYPPRFRVFEPTCDTAQLDQCTSEEIDNSYDNTIVYTDYFLSRAIDLLRRYDAEFDTVMLYVGDHGESLGEHGVYLHGLPYWIAPEAQVHVPMVLWLGKHYDDADAEALRAIRDTPMSHDNLFHTLLGVFEVESAVYDDSLDILQRSRRFAAERARTSAQDTSAP
ncbi:MAG: phosphoethanolamine--lipid A transferase [Gammaproteobacteria bacterium]